MATEPKELDFMGMLASDPEYVRLQQRRAIARALQEGTLRGPADPTTRRNPLAVALDFMSLRKGQSDLRGIQDQEAQLFQQHKAAEQGGIDQLLAGLNDPQQARTALARAMASQYPGLRKMAEGMNKTQSDQFGQILQHTRIDTPSAIASGGVPGLLKPAAPLPEPQLMSGTDESGVKRTWLQRYDKDGVPQVNMFPVPAIGSINTAPINSAFDVWKDQAKEYTSGKTFEKGQMLQGQMQATNDLLNTLSENPRMGAGAEAFQIAGKWLETITGRPTTLTGTTDQMKSQLRLNVLSALGSLGVGISEGDRQMIADAVGSLDTDPRAFRRLLLLQLKNQAKVLTRLQYEASRIGNQPPKGEGGLVDLTTPYTFTLNLTTDDDANDFETMLANRIPKLRPRTQPSSGAPLPDRFRPLR